MFSRKLSVFLLAAIAALFIATSLTAARPAAYEEREEIKKTLDLSHGATVHIEKLNGPVTIETWDQPKADIYILKSTNEGRDELDRLEIIIEHSSNNLEIRSRKDGCGEERRRRYDDCDNNDVRVRTKAIIKLPRQMSLQVGGINGTTTIGAVEGPIEIGGINGRVKIEQASEGLEASGINGSITAKLINLSKGIRMSGINGSIDLGIPSNIDADIDVTGQNGDVDVEGMDVTVRGKQRRNEFRGRIGSGGMSLRFSGINGSINFHRLEAAK